MRPKMSAFDRLSGALQYQIVNTLGFRELRPVQLESIDAILDGKNAVVLAPTAGGKTQAAFFPLLSQMDTEDWRPVSVLYLSPIRALLNNQEARVSKYAGLVGRRAFKWHGDTAQSARRRLKVVISDMRIALRDKAGESEVAIRQSLEKLIRDGRPTEADALAYASGERPDRLSKFDACLPEDQLLALLRERRVHLVAARKALEAYGASGSSRGTRG